MTTILEEAQEIVAGARQQDYGPPSVNHARTAGLYNAYLSALIEGIEDPWSAIHRLTNLNAEDVCWLNNQQKVSREINRPTRDGLVDVAGYAHNIELVRGHGVPTGTETGK